MSEVMRFSWVGVRGLAEQHNGNWVKYEDYAALQQRAEAAEAKLAAARGVKKSWQERAWTAEEKLADLDKQEPVAMRYRWSPPHMKMPDGSQFYGDWRMVADAETANPGKDYERVNLYARPAPPINLAELVPDEGFLEETSDESMLTWQRGWNACRTTILRNIEEQSK